jgi:hypothetical protein
MTRERILRLAAGNFVLLSILLAYFVDPRWIWLTGFVGANLLQSAFSNWCPLVTILRKMGLPS